MAISLGRENPRLVPLKILILDEDTGYRNLMASELRNLGVSEVTGVSNPKDALTALSTGTVDALITEMVVPFIKFLRSNPKSPAREIPIIVMTNPVTVNEVIEARDAGIHTFVAKPVSAQDLANHIIHAIDDSREIIKSNAFTGPDRRRREDPGYDGKERRTEPREDE